jgi:preprotein translocase subunit SecB
MTPLSPLQLRQHCFTQISLHANPTGASNGQISLDPEIWFQNNPANANEWLLCLRVTMKSTDAQKPFVYEADVAIQGIVEVHESFPTERREQLAVVNGLGLLYSAVRELLLMMTARSVHGLMCLPTLNFIDVVANKIAQDKANENALIAPQPGVPSGQK